jgi:hypothetical protein
MTLHSQTCFSVRDEDKGRDCDYSRPTCPGSTGLDQNVYAAAMLALAQKEGRLKCSQQEGQLPKGHLTKAIKSALADGPKMAAEIMDCHPEIRRKALASTLGSLVKRGHVERSGPKNRRVYSLKAEQTTAERLRDAIEEAEA